MAHNGDNEQELRRKALAALQAGVIPRDPPRQIWGGSGSGEVCPVCGMATKPSEMELEVEFASVKGGSVARAFSLHMPCFAAWEMVRNQLAVNPLPVAAQ